MTLTVTLIIHWILVAIVAPTVQNKGFASIVVKSLNSAMVVYIKVVPDKVDFIERLAVVVKEHRS